MPVKFTINFRIGPGDKTNVDSPRAKSPFFKGDNGCTVILVHGFTGSPQEMFFLAKYLNRKGYSVACPRLANHGESIEILRRTKWQECYHSVRNVLLDLKSTNNKGPIFVAGLSIGAILGLLLAAEFPSEIFGVSCLSPILFYDGWNSPKCRYWLPLVYFARLQDFFYFKEEPPYGIKNEAIRKRVHEYYNNADLKKMKDVYRYGYPYYPVSLLYQHSLLVKHVMKRIPGITAPTQIIQALEDDMSSIKNAHYIYDRVQSSLKDLVLLEDSYHVITVDQEREKVAENLERFFTRIIQSKKGKDEQLAFQ